MNARSQCSEGNWPRAGVGVLLIDEFGRALLTLRKLPPEAGCWSILGGKVNFLEPLEECAIREHAKKPAWKLLSNAFCVSPITACPAKASTGYPRRSSAAS